MAQERERFLRNRTTDLSISPQLRSAARDELASMGIFITTPSSITDPNSQSILSQSVAADEEIKHGTVVTVTLVTGDDAMLGRY